jgi:hypothetical protein
MPKLVGRGIKMPNITYFMIGGAILGFLFAGSGNRFAGIVVGAMCGAAVRQWIFRKFWM